MPGSHTAEFYLVLDAEVYGSKHTQPYVRKVRARRITQNKPPIGGGEIALKLEVKVPDAAFLRLIPDVAITIPDGFWTSQPVEVYVAEPDEEPPGG